MDSVKPLSFKYERAYGAEIELNSFDNRDFKTNPLKGDELPEGIYDLADEVREKLGFPTSVHGWQATHNNKDWRFKPDSSCGIEICSPVLRGWNGLKEICQVVDLISSHPRVLLDDRCSFHVHIDLSDCNHDVIAKILAYWVKCESVFLDSVPSKRKRNRYCQQIGISSLFEHDKNYSSDDIIHRLGSVKYYTVNCYHYAKGSRTTIEFRIAEGEGCRDSVMAKNWIRLLVHFVEMAKQRPWPAKYSPSDPWSSLLWLDPEEVMELLGFDGSYPLSKGLEQTRNWFLARLHKNSANTGMGGIWSEQARQIAKNQVERIVNKLGIEQQIDELLIPSDKAKAVYDPDFKI